MMIAAGIDPGEVMRRMGHSTVAMTLDRYTHALKGSETETAKRMQAFVDRSRGTVLGQSRPSQSGPERS